ncbi:MAG: hypothetical protein FWD87_10445 [Spirochaetaceae bacterium]|nr:hypothetical protein [Spirochaetaceae bacterium]
MKKQKKSRTSIRLQKEIKLNRNQIGMLSENRRGHVHMDIYCLGRDFGSLINFGENLLIKRSFGLSFRPMLSLVWVKRRR